MHGIVRSILLLVCAAAVNHAQPLPLDLAGRPFDPLDDPNLKTVVLLFVRTDCPISNRYAPELKRLFAKYSRPGVSFWLVYPSRDDSAEIIRRHISEYGYPFGALRDPDHALVRIAKARVTPEAAVFASGRRLVYRGRIDDRY